MKNGPRVSCLCPTYNRPPHQAGLLEEAIESFLRQDYPNRELIVLNDCSDQTLVSDAPGVRIVNADRRLASLGEKLNAAAEQASGDLLAPWDDDDVSLPWRLSQGVRGIADGRYFHPGGYWFLDPNGLHSDHRLGLAHACTLFTREGFVAAGGYPATSGDFDQRFDGRIRDLAGIVGPTPASSPVEWSYVYRWGVSPVHLSGRRPHDPWYAEIGRRPVASGTYRLRPRWSCDWVATTRAALRAGRALQPAEVA